MLRETLRITALANINIGMPVYVVNVTINTGILVFMHMHTKQVVKILHEKQ